MILGLKHNSLTPGQFDPHPPCTKRDPYTPCNKGLSDQIHLGMPSKWIFYLYMEPVQIALKV